mmetsp:Transcript_85489/g.265797  ORF Transcript_85489/g.265797 Transcript_85489/m.265797 type:complete len:86 (-) Transcript_85489:1107-1364(-)
MRLWSSTDRGILRAAADPSGGTLCVLCWRCSRVAERPLEELCCRGPGKPPPLGVRGKEDAEEVSGAAGGGASSDRGLCVVSSIAA